MKTSIAEKLGRLGPPAWPVVFLVICSSYGILAVLLGKEMNWDLLNYHFYNGYAFLTGRFDLDLAPAQTQTFLNPLLDVPLYLAIVMLPPVLVGAAYGFVQGLNGCAVWLIGRAMLPIAGVAERAWAAFALALVSGLAAINVGELGGSMGDTLVSIPVLFSVALLLQKRDELGAAPNSVLIGWAALAGALSGIGVGLKSTSAVYSVGFAVGCLFLVHGLGKRLLAAGAYAAGAAGAWLLLDSFWLWQMWSRFGDPFFPYLRLFNSRPEFVGIVAGRDTRFLPTSWVSTVFYPFVWTTNPSAVSEASFRDWRFSMLYLLLAVLVIRWCVRRWGHVRVTRQRPAGAVAFLLVGGLASYTVWLLTFGVYRYLAPLEWLAPLCITLALLALLPPRYRIITIVVVLTLMTVTTKPTNWGRAGWTRSYFGVVAPELPRESSSTILIAGLNGLSFMIPYFPEEIRFVRLQSNSFLFGTSLGGAYSIGASRNQLDRLVKRAIAAHPGKLYVMFDGSAVSPANQSEFAGGHDLDAILQRLHLQRSAESCRPVQMLDTSSPFPPYAVVRPRYAQPLLLPTVTVCSVVRGPSVRERYASPEFQGVVAPIARLYMGYFDRIPDQQGLEHWLTEYKAGKSLASISEVFASSAEFQARYGSPTNEEFVRLVYENVLDRDPDPAGLARWVDQLGKRALTRGQVMLEFFDSPEFRQISKGSG